MTSSDSISQKLINFFTHSFSQNQPVNFRQLMHNPVSVLILFPSIIKLDWCKDIRKFTTLFPQSRIVLFHPGIEKKSSERDQIELLFDLPITFLESPRHDLYHLIKSDTLREIRQLHFDILIDLNPDFCLLNVCLSRVLNPPIRIGFSKSKGNWAYNIQYNVEAEIPYLEKLKGLHQFMQSFC